MGGWPPKRSKTELDGCYLERSSHELAQSPPPLVPESEDLGSDVGDPESESESDAENLQDLNLWEYRRILECRITPTGRPEALLEWEPTWVPEDEVGDLKRALRRYAKERRGVQSPAKNSCPNCGAKKLKYDA